VPLRTENRIRRLLIAQNFLKLQILVFTANKTVRFDGKCSKLFAFPTPIIAMSKSEFPTAMYDPINPLIVIDF